MTNFVSGPVWLADPVVSSAKGPSSGPFNIGVPPGPRGDVAPSIEERPRLMQRWCVRQVMVVMRYYVRLALSSTALSDESARSARSVSAPSRAGRDSKPARWGRACVSLAGPSGWSPIEGTVCPSTSVVAGQQGAGHEQREIRSSGTAGCSQNRVASSIITMDRRHPGQKPSPSTASTG